MPLLDDLRRAVPWLADMSDQQVAEEYSRRAGIDLNTAVEDLEIPRAKPGFMSDMRRGAGQMAGSVGSALRDTPAEGVGRGLERYGNNVAFRNPGQVNTMQDVIDHPLTTLREGAGEMIPQVGASIATGLAGRVAGGVIGGVLGGPPGALAGQWIGGLGAAALPTYAQEYGGIRADQREHGTEDIGRAAVAAGAATGLEFAGGPEAMLAKRMLGRAARTTAGTAERGTLATMGREGLKQGVIEGPLTEIPQTALERWGAQQDLLSPQAMDEYAVAGAKGFAGGAAFGAPMGLMDRSAARTQVMNEEQARAMKVRELLARGRQVDLLGGGAQADFAAPEQGDLFGGGGAQVPVAPAEDAPPAPNPNQGDLFAAGQDDMFGHGPVPQVPLQGLPHESTGAAPAGTPVEDPVTRAAAIINSSTRVPLAARDGQFNSDYEWADKTLKDNLKPEVYANFMASVATRAASTPRQKTANRVPAASPAPAPVVNPYVQLYRDSGGVHSTPTIKRFSETTTDADALDFIRQRLETKNLASKVQYALEEMHKKISGETYSQYLVKQEQAGAAKANTSGAVTTFTPEQIAEINKGKPNGDAGQVVPAGAQAPVANAVVQESTPGAKGPGTGSQNSKVFNPQPAEEVDVEPDYERGQAAHWVVDQIEKRDPRKAMIFKLRTGLQDGTQHTNKAIAKELSDGGQPISEQRVGQVYAQAEKIFKDLVAKHNIPVEDFHAPTKDAEQIHNDIGTSGSDAADDTSPITAEETQPPQHAAVDDGDTGTTKSSGGDSKSDALNTAGVSASDESGNSLGERTQGEVVDRTNVADEEGAGTGFRIRDLGHINEDRTKSRRDKAQDLTAQTLEKGNVAKEAAVVWDAHIHNLATQGEQAKSWDELAETPKGKQTRADWMAFYQKVKEGSPEKTRDLTVGARFRKTLKGTYFQEFPKSLVIKDYIPNYGRLERADPMKHPALARAYMIMYLQGHSQVLGERLYGTYFVPGEHAWAGRVKRMHDGRIAVLFAMDQMNAMVADGEYTQTDISRTGLHELFHVVDNAFAETPAYSSSPRFDITGDAADEIRDEMDDLDIKWLFVYPIEQLSRVGAFNKELYAQLMSAYHIPAYRAWIEERLPITAALAREYAEDPEGQIQIDRAGADPLTQDEAATRRDTSGQGVAAALDHRVWHGTPHQVHETGGFTTQKIGTGEGAQAYGWGLYFASAKGVAQFYRENLSTRDQFHSQPYLHGVAQVKTRASLIKLGEEIRSNADKIDLSKPPNVRSVVGLMSEVMSFGMNYHAYFVRDVFGEARRTVVGSTLEGPNENTAQAIRDAVDTVLAAPETKPGRLYEVELAPDESDYLDYDNTVSPEILAKIPPDMYAKFEEFLQENKDLSLDELTGAELYKTIALFSDVEGLPGVDPAIENSNEAASRYLAAVGIPGIKFLDGSSRKKGEGNHNFVIFDDSSVKEIVSYESRMPPPGGTRAEEVAPIREQLAGRAKEMFGDQPGLLKLAEWITNKSGRKVNGIHTTGGEIGISLAGPHPVMTMNHEGFHHAMRYHFSAYEQNVLLGEFTRGSEMAQRVEQALTKDGLEGWVKRRQEHLYQNEGIGNEEIVAYAFQYWKNGDLQFNKPVTSAFKSFTNFLARIADWLLQVGSMQGINFPQKVTAEDLFVKLDTGGFAKASPNALGSPAVETMDSSNINDFAPDAPYPNELKKAPNLIMQAIKDTLTHWKKSGLQKVVFAHDLADIAVKEGLTKAQGFFDLINQKSATRTRLEAEVDRVMTESANTGDRKAVNAFLQKATREQKWGYVPTWRSDVTVDPVHEAAYSRLSPEAKTLVDSVFKYGDETYAETQRLINKEINDEYDKELAAKPGEKARIEKERSRKLQLVGRKMPKLVGPYAPLKRFGEFVAVGKSKAYLDAVANHDKKALEELQSDENHYRVEFYDTLYEAKARARELQPLFPEPKGTDAFPRQQVYRDIQELPWTAISKVKHAVEDMPGDDKVKTALNRVLTDIYLTMMVESSARKSEMRRKNITGEDRDMLRSFATQGRASAQFLASLQHNGEIGKQLTDMQNEARDGEHGTREDRTRVMNEIFARYAQGLDYRATPLANKAMRLASIWMLVTTPSYYFQNATQPFMITLPMLNGKFGAGPSWAAMTKAYRDVAPIVKLMGHSLNIPSLPFSEDERAMLEKLRDAGKIDITIAQDLGRWTEGESVFDKGPFGNVMRKVWGLPQKVEMINRVTSALAAHRLSGGNFDYVSRVIDQTHGNYATSNAPRFMSGSGAQKMIFQFRKYQLIQVSLLGRLVHDAFKGATKEEKAVARASLTWMMSHHMVMAGTLGLPAVNIVGMILTALGGDDDEPKDLERMLRKAIDDEDTSNLILKGLPAALGIDLSNRIGMGNAFSILPYTDVNKLDRDNYAKTLMGASGAFLGGLMPQWVDGMGYMAGGDMYKGMEAMLPRGIKDAMKAFRFATEGVTLKTGDQVMAPDEMDLFDVMFQGVGLPTMTVSERQRRQGDVLEMEQYYKGRTGAIKHRYTKAYQDNDSEEIADLRKEWTAVNESQKRNGFRATPLSSLLKAPSEQRKREKNAVGGVETKASNRGFVEMNDAL